MTTTTQNNKIIMGIAPFVVLLGASIGVRWLMSPAPSAPIVEAAIATTAPIEPTTTAQVEPTEDTALDRDALTSQFRDDAQSVGSFLVDTIRGRAWALSKLPEDEVNNLCWEVRVSTQSLKDQFSNTTALDPTQFAGHEQTLIDDQVCKLARHYQITGVGPAKAYIDISSLEGVPTEWRATDGNQP